MGSNEFDNDNNEEREKELTRVEQTTSPDQEADLQPKIAHKRTRGDIIQSIMYPPFDAVVYRVRP